MRGGGGEGYLQRKVFRILGLGYLQSVREAVLIKVETLRDVPPNLCCDGILAQHPPCVWGLGFGR